jgi:hypothetical protein
MEISDGRVDFWDSANFLHLIRVAGSVEQTAPGRGG